MDPSGMMFCPQEEEEDKPKRIQIGFLYVGFVDANGNGKHDKPEQYYTVSAGIGALETRFISFHSW